MTAKILVTLASICTMGFGIWHFFVPKAWKWYSYMQENATELVVAVRAINVFFSLSLVIFGAINLVFLYHKPQETFALKVMLIASTLMWAVRIVMQVVYPQGTINPYLRYGMLSAFIIIFMMYLVSLIIICKGA